MVPGSNNKGLMLTVCVLEVLGHSFESWRNINYRNYFWLGETEERWRQRLEYEINKQRQQEVCWEHHHMGKNSSLYGTGYTQNTIHTVILRYVSKTNLEECQRQHVRFPNMPVQNKPSYVGVKMTQKRAVKKVTFIRRFFVFMQENPCSCN